MVRSFPRERAVAGPSAAPWDGGWVAAPNTDLLIIDRYSDTPQTQKSLPHALDSACRLHVSMSGKSLQAQFENLKEIVQKQGVELKNHRKQQKQDKKLRKVHAELQKLAAIRTKVVTGVSLQISKLICRRWSGIFWQPGSCSTISTPITSSGSSR
jgi:hypothetical protein